MMEDSARARWRFLAGRRAVCTRRNQAVSIPVYACATSTRLALGAMLVVVADWAPGLGVARRRIAAVDPIKLLFTFCARGIRCCPALFGGDGANRGLRPAAFPCWPPCRLRISSIGYNSL